MTHFLQRSALILLATTALCAEPALAAKATHRPAAPAAPTAANGKIVTLKGERAAYVVKKGDTLEKIADRLDTTVAELMKTNGLKKTSVLQPGDVVKGPPVTKKAYVVARGDTVFSIAKRFHVSVDELRQENDLTAKTSIKPGQKIRLPADYKAPAVEAADDQPDDKADAQSADKADSAPSKAAKGRKGKPAAEPAEASGAAPDRSAQGTVVTREAKGETYKVKKGDTIAKVADRLDTDVGVLKRLNHLKGNAVRPGQVLRGPSFAEHIYTAQPGDTLASIARRFSVSVASLRAENELSRRVLSVKSGQKIFLPDGYRDREAPVEPRPTTRYPQPYVPGAREPEPTLPTHPIPYAPPGGQTPPAVTPPTPGPSDAQISQMGKGRFTWPITGTILSDFGPKAGGQRNDGINIQADMGATVRASADGDVVYAGNQVPGFGNLVLIKHPDGWATVYAHLSRIDVKNQQKVTQGQQVGQAGDTGGVSEPQVHFEVRYTPSPTERARSIDPKLVLPPKN